MDPTLAFRVGLLMGELANRGVNAVPIMDENGFTNQMSIRLDEPYSHIELKVTVELNG
jgi:hypothetical protein